MVVAGSITQVSAFCVIFIMAALELFARPLVVDIQAQSTAPGPCTCLVFLRLPLKRQIVSTYVSSLVSRFVYPTCVTFSLRVSMLKFSTPFPGPPIVYPAPPLLRLSNCIYVLISPYISIFLSMTPYEYWLV